MTKFLPVSIAAVSLFASCLLAADKPKPQAKGEVGNDDIDISATAYLDPADMRDALGTEIDPGYVVVLVKTVVKSGEPTRISPDDFTLVSRKNGDRADSMAPAQITSSSALTVRRDTRGRDWAQQTNEPGFIGVGAIHKVDHGNNNESDLLKALKEKQFPDKEIKSGSLEGLVYFALDASKLKPKDLALIYKGKARLSLDFKEAK